MIQIDSHFMRRRFLDFKNGHGGYLIYFISFVQFIIVSYSLYISGHPSLVAVFPTVYHWIGFFLASYLPLAVIIGHLHLKKQVPTEAKQATQANPYTFQASPGKESLYTLPAAVMDREKQLRSMRMHNQLVDFYTKQFGFKGDKWTEQDFKDIEMQIMIPSRLLQGESITEIAKDSSNNSKQQMLSPNEQTRNS